MNEEIKIKFPGQILDYVDTEEHLLELFNYINNLQEQVKQKDNTLKELRGYIEEHKETREHYEPYGTPMGNSNYITTHIFGYYELLEILDKGEQV